MLSFLVDLSLLSGLVGTTAYMISVDRRLKALNKRLRTVKAASSAGGPAAKGFAELASDMTGTVAALKRDAETLTQALTAAAADARQLLEEIDWSVADADIGRKLAARARDTRGDGAARQPDIAEAPPETEAEASPEPSAPEHSPWIPRFERVSMIGATIIPFRIPGLPLGPLLEDVADQGPEALGVLAPDAAATVTATHALEAFHSAEKTDGRG